MTLPHVSASTARYAALALSLAVPLAALAAPQAPRPDAGVPPTPQQAAEFFEAKVRPILAENCSSCHGAAQQSGGVRLDSRAGALASVKAGPIVAPGDPDHSRLVQVVRYDGPVKMPPTGRLTHAQVQTLIDWVRMGAPWPTYPLAAPAGSATRNSELETTHSTHWAFLPVRKPALPKLKNAAWCSDPVDYFVLAALERKGLTPSPRADRRTLIRRATYDLTGLPPTADEIAAFVNDRSPNAWEKVVDRLLASPRYGERWGRHWLDVARYADTKGYVFVEDRHYPNAYTYRDYVIRAFNEDLPYDAFVKEQLAADLMPEVRDSDDKRPLAAEGFLTVGRRFLNNAPDIIDDRIDVTCRGLMGLTVNCARCHDHKFDPIPQADYYSLYGVFASSQESNPPPPISPKEISAPYEAQNKKVLDADRLADDLTRAQVARLRFIVNAAPKGIPPLSDEMKRQLQGLREDSLPNANELMKLGPAFEPGVFDKITALRKTAADLRRTMPTTPEFAMAMQDLQSPMTPHIFRRGNPNNPGPEVPREFLQLIAGPGRRPFEHGSGRLDLAEAIASPTNPLTSRVIVNRIWLWNFGAGLVRTPSDFGMRGDEPTNPALLDWLAYEFVSPKSQIQNPKSKIDPYACGWSIKRLQRLILLSSTYQQTSDMVARSYAIDPENRLTWRFNRQRLDLEELRDSLLAASGKLDLKMGGPSVELTTAPFSTRRTVYGFIDRQNLQGLYRTFDFATPDASSPQRYTTTIPQQALFMMNSPFVVEQAQALMRRPEVAACANADQRVRAIYRIVFGRMPTQPEVHLGLDFVRPATSGLRQASLTEQQPASLLSPWERYVQALLMTNEFAFVD